MKVSDLIVEVRDADLNRVGQILATDLVGFTGVLRFRSVGTWEIPLRYDNPLADALRAPGAGIIVTGPTGVLFSGPTTSATRAQSQDDPVGTWTIKGVTDEVVLGERLAYPTPTTADVSAQVDEQDVRSGVASAVMYGFVNANIGPSAPTARKIPALTMAADPAVGSTVIGRARFENLGNLLTRLAQIDGLGFGIKQDGSDLVFSVYEPTDRSAYIRMDIDNNVLTKSEYTYTAPTATRAIVAGGGAGTSRAFAEVTTTESETAETAWGRRIELFKDKRQTSDPDELLQAGTEELADKGKTLEAISVSPSDDSTMAFGVDWELGDKVSVVAGLTTISQVVTEVGISIDEDGVRIGATVGEPSVADEDSSTADVQQDQEVRITNLEVNATDSGGGSSGSTAWADITDKPSTFAPSAHASSHASGGADAITVAESQVTGLTSALAGKAATSHTHTIANVTGLQAALDSKTVPDDSGWLTSGITAASGWSISSQEYRRRNGITNGIITVSRTGSAITVPSTGNIANTNIATLPSGFYNSSASTGMVLTAASGPLVGGYISSAGVLIISAASSGSAIATGDSFSFTFWEMTN